MATGRTCECNVAKGIRGGRVTIGNYTRFLFIAGVVMILSAFGGILMSAPTPVVSARIIKVQDLDSRVSYILVSGRLTSAEHELQEGYVSIGPYAAIMLKPGGTPMMIAKQFLGKDVELIIREVRK